MMIRFGTVNVLVLVAIAVGAQLKDDVPLEVLVVERAEGLRGDQEADDDADGDVHRPLQRLAAGHPSFS